MWFANIGLGFRSEYVTFCQHHYHITTIRTAIPIVEVFVRCNGHANQNAIVFIYLATSLTQGRSGTLFIDFGMLLRLESLVCLYRLIQLFHIRDG